MELWFIYALLSAVFTGLQIFTQKVAVERGQSSVVVNVYSGATTAILAFGVVFFTGSGGTHWELGIIFGLITGLIYMTSSIMRMDSLKYIDTAVFFPLYKTVSPIFALIIGMLFFNEWFTPIELFGLALSVCVPLLLIHKSENARQNNLKKGLLLMFGGALLTVIAQATAKYGTAVFENIFLFVAVSSAFSVIAGVLMHFFIGKRNGKPLQKADYFNARLLQLAVLGGTLQFAAYTLVLFAYKEGTLAVVYTINSFYILIPIILSIIIYKEHWNARKALAIGLSVVALIFLR